MNQLKSLEQQLHERLRGTPLRLVDVPTKEEKHWKEISEQIDLVVADARTRFQRMYRLRKFRKTRDASAIAHKAIIKSMRANLGRFAACTMDEKQQIATIYKDRVNAAMKEEVEGVDFVRPEIADASEIVQ